MPSLHNTATTALALFFVLISGSTGQVERELQPITCGQTVTVAVAGDNDFFPYMLDLTLAAGNQRLDFHTCSSRVRDPDLCLGAEYIDDDQIATSNSGGDCLWRNPSGNPVGLGENVSYVVVPGTYPIQIGTYRGTGNVTLILACSDTTDVATVLKSNPDKCFGDRSVLTQAPTPGPTSSAPTAAPASAAPTPAPTAAPASSVPSAAPTAAPVSSAPTTLPTAAPGSSQPTAAPTPAPTAAPASSRPTTVPSAAPSSAAPTAAPTAAPGSSAPTTGPSAAPASSEPTSTPSAGPTTATPTAVPSATPTTAAPTAAPSAGPTTSSPTTQPTTSSPTSVPTTAPSGSNPTAAPTTAAPTTAPSAGPTTSSPTSVPTTAPSGSSPTATPTAAPASSAPTPVPTAGPSSTSPTPAPTTPPTGSPNTPAPTSSPATTGPTPMPTTGGPTVPPSTSPTRNMTLVNMGATDNGTDQSAATSSWWPLLLVLLLLAVLLLIGFMVRRGPKKEAADDSLAASAEALNPMFADFVVADDAAAAALLVPFLAGDEPIYALAGENNALYDAFRRAVAFDTMYYGNPPLAVDNTALAAVYKVLGARPPATVAMAPLRELCQRFLDSEVDTAAPSEAALYDVVKFMWAAIADELVERAIDALATQGCGPADPIYELGGTSNTEAGLLERALYALCEDYVPADNEYLVPVDGTPDCRALPGTSWEHEPMYDLGGKAAVPLYNIGGRGHHGADTDQTYELAGGGAGAADYSMADFKRTSVCPEYAQSSPHTGAALGGDATYALAAGDEVAETEHDDNIYTMASGNVETVETMYNFGAGSRPMSLAGKDATYDLAGTQAGDTDCDTLRTRSHGPVYDMGGRLEHLAAGTRDIEQLYDNVAAAALPMSAAAKRMSAAVMSVYDTAASAACPRSPPLAVYDAASTWQAGAIESDCDDGCNGGEPEAYLQVLGAADGSGLNGIVPALYETAAGSAAPASMPEYEDELGDAIRTLSTVNPEYVTPRPGSVFVDADMQLRFKSVHRQSPFTSAH